MLFSKHHIFFCTAIYSCIPYCLWQGETIEVNIVMHIAPKETNDLSIIKRVEDEIELPFMVVYAIGLP